MYLDNLEWSWIIIRANVFDRSRIPITLIKNFSLEPHETLYVNHSSSSRRFHLCC
jgi:hypothetical protein